MLRMLLRRAKTDPFGKGVFVCLGRTSSALCPVAAVLGHLAVCPLGEGPLFVFRDGTPLSRDRFVREVRVALAVAHIDHQAYLGYSFHIGAASTAAQAGPPAYMIKMLRRWTSDAYLLYVCTPPEILPGVSRAIAH